MFRRPAAKLELIVLFCRRGVPWRAYKRIYPFKTRFSLSRPRPAVKVTPSPCEWCYCLLRDTTFTAIETRRAVWQHHVHRVLFVVHRVFHFDDECEHFKRWVGVRSIGIRQSGGEGTNFFWSFTSSFVDRNFDRVKRRFHFKFVLIFYGARFSFVFANFLFVYTRNTIVDSLPIIFVLIR